MQEIEQVCESKRYDEDVPAKILSTMLLVKKTFFGQSSRQWDNFGSSPSLNLVKLQMHYSSVSYLKANYFFCCIAPDREVVHPPKIIHQVILAHQR